MTSAKTEPPDRATILVVEDEPVLLDLARMMLEDGGYRVLCAASRTDALAQWQKARGQIDLLFTDMLLPEEGSGRQLADQFCREKSELKIIFTSALAEAEFEADLKHHQGSSFLQKPYTKVELTLAVQNCLDGKPH